MPKRSSVKKLPKAVQEWINKSLVESDFSGYNALADALKAKGYKISKSSLHRYGSDFEESLQAIKMSTEMAKAVVDACPDDVNNMGEALTRLVQQKAFKVLTEMKVNPEKIKLADIGHMVATVNRTSISQKKYAAEVRAKIENKLKKMETEAKAGKSKFDPDTLKMVREEIYGLI